MTDKVLHPHVIQDLRVNRWSYTPLESTVFWGPIRQQLATGVNKYYNSRGILNALN